MAHIRNTKGLGRGSRRWAACVLLGGAATAVLGCSETPGGAERTQTTAQALGGPVTLISPTAGTTASTSVTFTWTSTGSATYQLYVAGAFNQVLSSTAYGCGSGEPTCSYPLVMVPGSSFWSVTDAAGPWAPAINFTVPGTPPPAAPTGLTPSGSATPSQVFAWTGDTSATSYQLYIPGVVNSTYSTASLGCGSGGTCTTPSIALTPGSNLTWNLRAINAIGSGAWSSASITVSGTAPPPAPPAPTGLAPSGSATTSQVFTWTGDASATSYQLYIAGVINTTYTTSALGCSSGGTCTTPAVALPAGNNLTWGVSGINATGNGTWSSASIAVAGAPVPAAPTALAPSGSATTTQIFTWTGDASATSYQFYMAGVADTIYTTASLGCSAGGTCTTPAITLAAGTSYTWGVSSINASGNGAWTSASITVPGTPPPPPPPAATGLAPSGPSTPSQVFTWTGDASANSYQLYIAGVINTTYTTSTLGCSSGGTCTTPALALPPGTTLTWGVSGINANGSGTWSSASITTSGAPVPPAPTALAPSGAATLAQVFTWTGDASATSYQLYMAGVVNTIYTTASLGCTAGGTCTTPAIALSPGTFTWGVSGINATGSGGWSSASITVPGGADAGGADGGAGADAGSGSDGSGGSDGGSGPLTLASGQNNPIGVAVDSTSVYWVDSNGQTVMKVAIGGGAAVTLATVSSGIIDNIAIDSTNVYFTTSVGAVSSVPIGGGSIATLVASGGQGNTYGIAVDSSNVYWTAQGNGPPHSGTVNKVPIGGGSVTTLASGLNGPQGIAVNASNVYWTNPGDGTVTMVALSGGIVTTLATGQSTPTALALDGKNVYWTDSNAVMEMPLLGGTTTSLSPASVGAGIAVDSTYVYWANNGGGSNSTVMRVPLGGGVATTLYIGGFPTAVAIDATSIYWTDSEDPGTVMELTP